MNAWPSKKHQKTDLLKRIATVRQQRHAIPIQPIGATNQTGRGAWLPQVGPYIKESIFPSFEIATFGGIGDLVSYRCPLNRAAATERFVLPPLCNGALRHATLLLSYP